MSHCCLRGLRFAFAAAVVVLVLPAQGDREKLRESTLRELQGENVGTGEAEAKSRARWPQYDREIEAGIADQAKVVAAGGSEVQNHLEVLANRARVQETPVAFYLYGRMLGIVDRLEEAKVQFETAIKQDPFFPWAYHGLGTCYAKRDRFEDAVKVYRRAIELNPRLTRTMEPLAACLIKLERYDEAEATLKRLLELDPMNTEAWMTTGKLNGARTRFADAVAAFRKVTELDVTNAEARMMVAYYLRKGGQLAEAATAYQAMVQKNPADFGAWLGLGETRLMMGKNHEAADAFEAASKVLPPNANISSAELTKRIAELRGRAPTEKRDPRAKSPQEWIDILKNSTEQERCLEAMRVLSSYPSFDPDIYKAYVQAVKCKFAPVRVLAIAEMGKRWEGQLEDLTPLISLFVADDKDPLVRAMAAHVLGMSRHDAAVPALIKALGDRDTYVFAEVHEALLKITPASVDAILPAPLDAAAMEATQKAWKAWYDQNVDRYRKYEKK